VSVPGALLAALALVLIAGPARAHTIIEGFPGWQGGLLHPFIVPAHALTLMGLALLTGQQRAAERWTLIAVFLAGFGAAIVLVTQAVSADNAELHVLGAGAACGLLVALGRALPLISTAALAAAGSIALALDSVPALNSVSETLAALFATALSASGALALVAWVSSDPRHDWQRIGTRIAGSWIAASTILVLALRLAR
jgi:urease accessory protein